MKKTREELVDDLHRRVDDHILEPSNAALLEKLIRQADDDNEAVMIASLGTTYKRTGLHFDKRLEKPTSDIHYLRRNAGLSFTDGTDAAPHRLVIGDNLHALQNLLVQHRGQVDVIYIDPPYGKDSMGQFAETNYENAITRDNLLSMLHPRLMLARQLLSESGVIFCSIDDRNQAYVKCLFDDVFGERNYIETFIWNKTSTPPALSNKSRKTHEFVLCYQKVADSSRFIGLVNEGGDAPLLNESNREVTLSFPANYVHTNMKDGLYFAGIRDRVELLDDVQVSNGIICSDFRLKGKFRWQQSTLDNEIANNCLLIVKSDKFAIRYCREGERTVAPANFVTEAILDRNTTISKQSEGVDTNEKAGKDLEEIMGRRCFDFPKPTSLISYLISFTGNTDALVLDFFAGSGTTGQAVLELNRQDGGNRRFILCQLNEPTDTTPNGIAHDVTAKRLKRVMTGKCYDGSRDFAWAQKHQPYGGSLEVVDVATVANFNNLPGQSAFDVIDEALYGQPRFETMEQKVDWVCSHFAITQTTLETDHEWLARRMEADNQ